jgi:2-polyprenyl-6-methoxyphenol hydroxylase-like FAD-dependent oxidoreductase
VPAALDQLRSDPDSAYFDSVSQIAMDSWSRGRVVLIGDAAWCVTLFAGYGAALALSGADLLGEALDEHGDDIPAALADWELRLRPETNKRQATARRGIAQFAPPTKVHIWMNEMVMRAITLPGIRHLVQRAIRASS